MTTSAQIRKLLKPLLGRHNDLVLSGQWLIVLPVNHLVRFVLIDRTSSASHFRPIWGGWHLFDPEPGIGIDVTRALPSNGSRCWQWSDPAIQDRLLPQIEQALPAIRAVGTIGDYLAFADDPLFWKGNPDDPHPRDLLFQVSVGNLEKARELCARLEANRPRWANLGLYDDFVTPLASLVMAGDRGGIARQLHAWEFERSRNPVVSRYWARTPFPFELATS